MGSAGSSHRAGPGEVLGCILILEVLGGQVNDREWRFGDAWTIGVLGLMRPYIRVTCRDHVNITDIAEVPLGSRDGSLANFDARMIFPMVDGENPEEDSQEGIVQVSMRDRRYIQGLLRGDPLVGHATLVLNRTTAGEYVRERVEFRRSDKPDVVTGWVNVQYIVIERKAATSILSQSAEHSVMAVVRALVYALRNLGSVDRLMNALPVKDPEEMDEAALDRSERKRERITQLVETFCSAVDGCPQHVNRSDEDVLQYLSGHAREVLVFIADFQLPEGPSESTNPVCLAIRWIENIFADLVDGHALRLNTERLERLFSLRPPDTAALVPVDRVGRHAMVSSEWTVGMRVPKEAVLGRGSYGYVWRAMDRHTKQFFAVKQMSFVSESVSGAVSARELSVADLLIHMPHPCVVRLLAVHQHAKLRSCSLVMEFCAGGDLQGKIVEGRQEGSYSVPALAMPWAAQVFLGLEHLHLTVKMLVRDVKPENVVLTRDLHAKLTDFGMSRLATTSDGAFSFHPCVPPGSPHYVAPEVILGCGYDCQADFYSLGVLLWTLLTGGMTSVKMPLPPCAPMAQGEGRSRLSKLTQNWKLLRNCIQDPTRHGARPLPTDETKDFILRLTDRGDDHEEMSHEDIRQHPFMEKLELPPPGDQLIVAEWLSGACRARAAMY